MSSAKHLSAWIERTETPELHYRSGLTMGDRK